MSDVTVTAVRSFQFEDRYITKGEDVTLPAIHAAVEARKGNVSLSRVVMRARAMKAEPPKPEPPTRRRRRRSTEDEPSQTYRRRDMTPEEPK